MRTLVLLAFATVACHRAPADTILTVRDEAGVPVYVDQVLVAHVPATLHGSMPLATLLPADAADPARWAGVDADGPAGRTLHVRHPAEAYPGAEARLYADAGGYLALGMFRANAATARPAVALERISAIRVRTIAVDPPAPPPATPAMFTLIDAGQARPVTRADLDALPRTKPPAGPRAPAYDLRDVLGLAGPTARGASVVVTPAEGDAVTLDAATLARPDRLALLKINRKGQRKLRVWSLGASPAIVAELDDVARIELR